jgi:hypothetical protein
MDRLIGTGVLMNKVRKGMSKAKIMDKYTIMFRT